MANRGEAAEDGGATRRSEARELADRHLGLVRAAAAAIYRRVRGHVEFDELVSLGMTGLLEAAGRYDPGSETTFTTFAHYRIRGAIIDGLREMAQLPHREWRRLHALRGADAYLEARAAQSGPPQPGDGAAAPLRALLGALGGVATVFLTSLEARCECGDEPGALAPTAEDIVGLRQLSRELGRALESLPARERAIVRLHYFEDKTLLEAGVELGLSKSWTSRLHARAVDRLRAALAKQRAI